MAASASETALLVMDIQNEVVGPYGGEAILENLKGAIHSAREAGVLVIYVVISLREGLPEVSSRNRVFAPLVQNDLAIVGDLYPELVPGPGEIRVVKKRVGAFSGSDLEMILRARGISSLVLTGISTSGVVLSTLQLASDLDYRVTVLSDCCKDSDDEVHRFLLDRIFPIYADVISARDWAATLEASANAAAART